MRRSILAVRILCILCMFTLRIRILGRPVSQMMPDKIRYATPRSRRTARSRGTKKAKCTVSMTEAPAPNGGLLMDD